MTQDFKDKLQKSMNRGGWGWQNMQEAMPLIDNHIKEQLILHGVSNWVAIESEEQPERVTDVMVKYKDNKKEVAFFDGDGRFYTQNDDDITDKIASWHKLP